MRWYICDMVTTEDFGGEESVVTASLTFTPDNELDGVRPNPFAPGRSTKRRRQVFVLEQVARPQHGAGIWCCGR